MEAIVKTSIFEEFETERLYLRLLLPSAASAALDYYKRNKEITEKWEPEYPSEFYTEEFQQRYLKLACEKYDERGALSLFIFTKETPYVPMGHISLFNVRQNAHHDAELGYKIDENMHNKGYCTEAIKKVIDIGFNAFDLERIEAHVSKDNPASVKVLEANGFSFEGTRRHHVLLRDHWIDHEVYSILSSEAL